MVFGEILPNVLAMISSFIAMILLGLVAPKIGGVLGRMLKLLIAGIFFAVFLHAGVELAQLYGAVDEAVFLPIMGALLTIGSALFMVAGLVGLKSLK